MSNLTNWGIFILEERFEKLLVKQQTEIANQAKDKLLATCQVFIQQADQFWDGVPAPMYKGLIGPGHRNCLATYNELTGSKVQKAWAASVASSTSQEECPWCGGSNKPGVAVCFNCKEVLNQELYDRLKGIKKAS